MQKAAPAYVRAAPTPFPIVALHEARVLQVDGANGTFDEEEDDDEDEDNENDEEENEENEEYANNVEEVSKFLFVC